MLWESPSTETEKSFTASVCSFCATTEAEGWPQLRFRATSETVVPAADSPPLIALALHFPRLMLVRTEFPKPFFEGERNDDGAEGVTEARMPPARGIRDLQVVEEYLKSLHSELERMDDFHLLQSYPKIGQCSPWLLMMVQAAWYLLKRSTAAWPAWSVCQ